MKRKSVLFTGLILVTLQGMAIYGNSKFNANPWDAPGFMKGSISVGQLFYSIFSITAYLLLGIIGLILISGFLIAYYSDKEDAQVDVSDSPGAEEYAHAAVLEEPVKDQEREPEVEEIAPEAVTAAPVVSAEPADGVALLLQLQAEEEAKSAD